MWSWLSVLIGVVGGIFFGLVGFEYNWGWGPFAAVWCLSWMLNGVVTELASIRWFLSQQHDRNKAIDENLQAQTVSRRSGAQRPAH